MNLIILVIIFNGVVSWVAVVRVLHISRTGCIHGLSSFHAPAATSLPSVVCCNCCNSPLLLGDLLSIVVVVVVVVVVAVVAVVVVSVGVEVVAVAATAYSSGSMSNFARKKRNDDKIQW